MVNDLLVFIPLFLLSPLLRSESHSSLFCKILLAKVIFLFQIIVFITFFNLFFVFSVPATKQICLQIAFPDIRLSELLDDSHDECFAYWTKWEE